MTAEPGRYARMLCSAVLCFEAVMMLLSILVLNGFSSLSDSLAAGIGGAMAAVCLIVAGLLARPWGFGLGHVVQVAILALGLLATPILFIGLVFAALWVVGYAVGIRIDRRSPQAGGAPSSGTR